MRERGGLKTRLSRSTKLMFRFSNNWFISCTLNPGVVDLVAD